MRVAMALIVVGVLGLGAARAQTPLAGPLSAPAEASPSDAATPKIAPSKPTHAKTTPAKVPHAKIKKPPKEAAKADSPDAKIPVTRQATDDNPLSLGMKWNGSNDSASQTRVQNYGGDAAGAGAAVGLKLHF